ncbi:MAG: response regulator [Chloroflexi bacterium]|nr:response regulator [Chloroflexota bacterium]
MGTSPQTVSGGVPGLRYRRLFEAVRDGILILDITSKQIVDANPYIRELLGYTLDEILGKEIWEIGLLKDQAASQRAYAELEAHGFIRYEDLPLESKDGERREVEFVSNVYDEGEHGVIQCNIRDITERKLAEARRDQRLVQTEKLRLLGELARGVAHNLNQSLGLISGYSDVALAALTGPTVDREALRSSLEIMAQAATDGGQTVGRLLTFARGHPDGPPEEISLAGLLSQVGQLTAPRWRDDPQQEGCSITLRVEVEVDTVIWGWPASIREALVNLVFNAVDALPRGGAIRLGACRQGQEVVVEVADTGIGIPPEVQSRIFEPLFTTKGVYGTGLGLTQVRSMVEHHGGRVSVDSTPGQGSTFRLAFPPMARGTGQNGSRHDRPRARGLRIIVVDDEPALATLIARMLGLDGHSVVSVHSGTAALDRLGMESFDLMISDMGMPGMNGWELISHVRARFPSIPIILASGWGSQVTAEEARTRGVHAVMAKPYRIVDLQRAIATLDASLA